MTPDDEWLIKHSQHMGNERVQELGTFILTLRLVLNWVPTVPVYGHVLHCSCHGDCMLIDGMLDDIST